MWLQLSVALAAEPAVRSVDAAVSTYRDQGIIVWAPGASVSGALGDKLTATGGWSADFISGATPLLVADAISSATPIVEQRHGANLALSGQTGPGLTLLGNAAGSVEPDHQSLVGGAGAQWLTLGDMTTLSASTSLAHIRDGRTGDMDYATRSWDGALELGWSQIWGPTTSTSTRLSGLYSRCEASVGCQANPYRFVPVEEWVLSERHPEARARLAANATLSQAFGPNLALHLGYRLYADSWQVNGHTGLLTVATSLRGDQLALRLRLRGATQSPAAFYRDTYLGAPKWRTADRELAGFTEAAVGGQARWSWFEVEHLARLSVDLSVERFWFVYPNYSELPRRDAWILSGGVYAGF